MEYIDVWLCEECMLAVINGELPEGDDDRAKEIEEGLAKLGRVSSNFGNDEEDGYDSFSWEPCDCCRTRLGGSRYKFALWVEE